MSNRTRILLIFGVLVLASIILQYFGPEATRVEQPHVSVKAEPVFHIGGGGVGLGPGDWSGIIINNSMVMTALVVLVLLILALIVRATASIYPKGFYNFMELIVDTLYNTFGAVDRRYIARFFPMVGTIFFYVLFSNWLALLPGVLTVGYYLPEEQLEPPHTEEARVNNALAFTGTTDTPLSPADGVLAQEGGGEGEGEHEGDGQSGEESTEGEGHAAEEAHNVLVPYFRSPSADLNNTIVLALIAALYAQFWGVRELGGSYFAKFFPVSEFKNGVGAGLIGIFVGLVEIVSELARVVSYAFRLFGNVFAGEVILLVMVFLLPVLQLPFLALEVFIGFIQAFVFAILCMVFSSLATVAHSHDEAHGHEGVSDVQHGEIGGATRANPVAH